MASKRKGDSDNANRSNKGMHKIHRYKLKFKLLETCQKSEGLAEMSGLRIW
jgi:hypothetical protein